MKTLQNRSFEQHSAALETVRRAIQAAEAQLAARDGNGYGHGHGRIVSFRLSSALLERFDTLAQQTGCGRSQLLRQIAAAFLAHAESTRTFTQGSPVDDGVFREHPDGRPW